jgi:hypothetical protein
MQEQYKCLFSYVLNEDISVKEFCSLANMDDIFHLPLSPETFQEYHEIQQVTQDLNISQSNDDSWTFKWGNSYTSRKYYKFMFRLVNPPTPFHGFGNICAGNELIPLTNRRSRHPKRVDDIGNEISNSRS